MRSGEGDTSPAAAVPEDDGEGLASFIERSIEPIMQEWVAFARECMPSAANLDLVTLRDHAAEMLADIVADLRRSQTDEQQLSRSRGQDDGRGGDSAAAVHGAGRAESGFTVAEMVSEYRALRASVIRLWTRERGRLGGSDIRDLVRFNEAIDQAVAESIVRYTQDLDRSKELFLAVLGHDLRTPLGAVTTASRFMLEAGKLEGPDRALTERVLRSSLRMTEMVSDLLDFTSDRLGGGVPILRQPMDLGTAVRHAVEEVRTAHPDRVLLIEATGDLWGEWDGARLAQALSNLLENAVVHGSPQTPITVTVAGNEEVALWVHNHGPEIPREQLRNLFSPFKRLGGREGAGGHLGLGLYITERIVAAHDGSIEVVSSGGEGTTFVVHLPRTAPTASSPGESHGLRDGSLTGGQWARAGSVNGGA